LLQDRGAVRIRGDLAMEAAFRRPRATKSLLGRLGYQSDRRTTELGLLELIGLTLHDPTSTAIAVMMLTTSLPDSWEGVGSTGSVL
jgi:hypothetical protein